MTALVPEGFHNSCTLDLYGDELTVSCSMIDRRTGEPVTFSRSLDLGPLFDVVRANLGWYHSQLHESEVIAGANSLADFLRQSLRAKSLGGKKLTTPSRQQGIADHRSSPGGFQWNRSAPPPKRLAPPTDVPTEDPNAPPPDEIEEPQDMLADELTKGLGTQVVIEDLWDDVQPMIVGGFLDDVGSFVSSNVEQGALWAAGEAGGYIGGPEGAKLAQQAAKAILNTADKPEAKKHVLHVMSQNLKFDPSLLPFYHVAINATKKATENAQAAAIATAAQAGNPAAQAVATQVATAALQGDPAAIQTAKAMNRADANPLALMASWR